MLCLAAGLALMSNLSQAIPQGLTANTPTIDFPGPGIIEYDQTTDRITISGVPSSLLSTSPLIMGEILRASADDIKDITITFNVNASGQLVANDTTLPDLVVNGSIDTDGIANYNGEVLIAEVTQFGFANGTAWGVDTFDLRVNNIGGSLAFRLLAQSTSTRQSKMRHDGDECLWLRQVHRRPCRGYQG